MSKKGGINLTSENLKIGDLKNIIYHKNLKIVILTQIYLLIVIIKLNLIFFYSIVSKLLMKSLYNISYILDCFVGNESNRNQFIQQCKKTFDIIKNGKIRSLTI